MNPKKVITGSKEWIEESIPGFKFQGQGWYNAGCILVVDYGDLYQAFVYDCNARRMFRDALQLPNY